MYVAPHYYQVTVYYYEKGEEGQGNSPSRARTGTYPFETLPDEALSADLESSIREIEDTCNELDLKLKLIEFEPFYRKRKEKRESEGKEKEKANAKLNLKIWGHVQIISPNSDEPISFYWDGKAIEEIIQEDLAPQGLIVDSDGVFWKWGGECPSHGDYGIIDETGYGFSDFNQFLRSMYYLVLDIGLLGDEESDDVLHLNETVSLTIDDMRQLWDIMSDEQKKRVTGKE